MPTTGEKPGVGSYKCTECGSLIKLKNNEYLLPSCSKCNNKEFEKVKTSKTARILAEIISFVFWIFLIIKILFYDIDNYIIQTYLPSFSWIIKYRFFILIGFLALFWLILKNKKFFALILFTFIYPLFFIFWRIPKFLFRTKNWVGVFAAIGILVSFFRSLKLNFVIFTLVMISGLLIITTNTKFTLIPSIAVLFLFLILHFSRRFSYGFKKFDILFKYADSVMKFWKQMQDKITRIEAQQKIEMDLSTDDKEVENRSNRLQWLLILNKACYFLVSKLRFVQKSGVTFLYYFLSLLYSVFLVIFIFSFLNLALSKIDPGSFGSHPKGGFIFFFYYSFNTFFTNNIANFYPESSWARLFNSAEILFGFLILVILFYFLFTIIREKQKGEIATSIIALERQGSEFEKIIKREYQITIEQAVKEVEKIKGSMLKVIYYFMSNIK